MGSWYDEVWRDRSRHGLKVERVLFKENSEFQLVEVLETAQWGKVLVLDGIFQTSVGEERYYHEMLVHPALACAERIERVLVVGGGDGGTVREVLAHPEVARVTMVELDARVVDVCKRYLPEIGSSWADPRLEVQIGDGAAYLRDYLGAPFDVIIVDGPDPFGAAEGLFARSFYQDCARCLTPGGIVVSQSEGPLLMPEEFARIVRSLGEAFARALPYFGPVPLYAAGLWAYCLATNDADLQRIDEARAQRMEARCHYYGRDIHRAAFAQPPFVKRLLA